MSVICKDSVLAAYGDDVDHIITDPPYSPKVHHKASTMRGGKAGKNDLKFSHLTPLLRASIAQRVALARSWSVIFSDWEGIGAWRRDIEESGGEWVRVIPWVRWSMPQLSGDRPPQGSEAVIVAHGGGKKTWNGLGSLTHFDVKCLRGKEKHPTEKPLRLMLQIVHHFTEPGSYILDPCAGGGTTVLAGKLLGRIAVGIEANQEFAAYANGRLDMLPQLRSERDALAWKLWQTDETQIEQERARQRSHTHKVRKSREVFK